MNKSLIAGLVTIGMLAAASAPALADGSRHHRHRHDRGWGPPPRVYYAPPPRVYYAPPPHHYYQPPPVIYVPPPPVYYYGPPSLSLGLSIPLR